MVTFLVSSVLVIIGFTSAEYLLESTGLSSCR